VVHCDLKPANILFGADGRAKLADFGISHFPSAMLTRTWSTQAGFVAGTLPYMSPEQADGVRDEPRSDIYALGATLYRMLTGRPYLDFDQRETPVTQVRNVRGIQEEMPLPPSAYAPGVPTALDQTVLRMLAKRPDDRYQSANALRAELLRLAQSASRPPGVACRQALRAPAGTGPRQHSSASGNTAIARRRHAWCTSKPPRSSCTSKTSPLAEQCLTGAARCHSEQPKEMVDSADAVYGGRMAWPSSLLLRAHGHRGDTAVHSWGISGLVAHRLLAYAHGPLQRCRWCPAGRPASCAGHRLWLGAGHFPRALRARGSHRQQLRISLGDDQFRTFAIKRGKK
jgi:hypothetical protein